MPKLSQEQNKIVAELYNNHYQALLKATARNLKDEFAAEDLVQDAFLRLTDKLAHGNDAILQSPRGFLAKIISDLEADYFRAKKSSPQPLPDDCGNAKPTSYLSAGAVKRPRRKSQVA